MASDCIFINIYIAKSENVNFPQERLGMPPKHPRMSSKCELLARSSGCLLGLFTVCHTVLQFVVTLTAYHVHGPHFQTIPPPAILLLLSWFNLCDIFLEYLSFKRFSHDRHLLPIHRLVDKCLICWGFLCWNH